MRLAPVLCICGALAFASPAAAQSPAAARDTEAVKALVAKYNAARDNLDQASLRELFTRDADQLVSSGEWRRGRQQLIEGMGRSSRANPGDRTLIVETVRFPVPDVAVADARYEIEGTGGAPARRMWSTFVAVRTAEGWRIDAIRNMLPAT